MKQIVSIIGAGTMGSGIAQIAASNGCQTIVYDINQDTLDQSKSKLDKILNRLIEKDRIDTQIKKLIQEHLIYTTNINDVKDSDLVIEAIVENFDVKTQLFQDVETLVSKECVIASNTSSLGITELAGKLSSPERFIGIHFFNPAPLMKLVEVIPALQTDSDVLRVTKTLIDSWGKVVVTAKDTPGFIVNKVARPFYSESFRIYEEGMASPNEIDTALKSIGFRMGPFELTDFIGHDVNYKVTETVWKAFGYDQRYQPAFCQKQLVQAGYLGRKTGRGFYKYPRPENIDVEIDKDKAKAITNRIVIMLINEAADTVHRNIASIEDIDTAMTKGVNYPKGLLKWADELGIEECIRRMDILFDEYHEERYRCSPMLRKLARREQQFYSK